MIKRNLFLVLWCCVFSSLLYAPDETPFDPKLPGAVEELTKRVLASFPETENNKEERRVMVAFLDQMKSSNYKTGRDALYHFVKNFPMYSTKNDAQFRGYTNLITKLLPELLLSKPPLNQGEITEIREKVVSPLLSLAKEPARFAQMFSRGDSPARGFSPDTIFHQVFVPVIEAKAACCGSIDAVSAFKDYITTAKALNQSIDPKILEGKIAKQMDSYKTEGAHIVSLLTGIAQNTNPQMVHDTLDLLLNRIIQGEPVSAANYRELLVLSEATGTNQNTVFSGMGDQSKTLRNKLRATLLHLLTPEFEKGLNSELVKPGEFRKNLESLKKSKTLPEVQAATARVDTIIKCLGAWDRMGIR
jgi:hypothetical protein